VDPEVIKDLRIVTTVDGLLEIPDRPHQIGSEVTIIEGLFKGGNGMVTRLIPARERVKVLLEFLGRPTVIEIDENSLDFPKVHPMRVS
jgi:transcriptional antiterminator RfaH